MNYTEFTSELKHTVKRCFGLHMSQLMERERIGDFFDRGEAIEDIIAYLENKYGLERMDREPSYEL